MGGLCLYYIATLIKSEWYWWSNTYTDQWNGIENSEIDIQNMPNWFFKTFYFVLGYSQLAMLWWFQVNSEGTQPYVYMYPFSPKLPSHPVCHITLSQLIFDKSEIAVQWRKKNLVKKWYWRNWPPQGEKRISKWMMN